MEYLAVLLPSVAVGLIFYFVMKAIFNADRAEREAESRERSTRENVGENPSQPPRNVNGDEQQAAD
ncbi:hypothetical protein GC088_00500 [Arthrobacter sp. JZ12]|uniref:hypothetical protein n=1 Tax=Arthrobacter sp. JZ12 TaxID=2654190 RepID=UPI002B48D7E5|nr:hypothetical protein [Arthrobacter sp. JZ12]WRH23753.1 hypothetical protein GC088_00500 [Arthrobacter sp. JZ12]